MTTPPKADPEQLSRQCQLVLSYLQSGRALTNLVALTNLGIGSLTSRIAELRKAGYPIVTEDKRDYHNSLYRRYSLPPTEPPTEA
jgi:hypothetical protein